MDYKIIDFKDFSPIIHNSVFIGHGVVIAGQVTIDENVSIWFNSVIRGDVAPITIGKNTNIQDAVVIHTSRFEGPTHIGNNITIGHMALIHACTIYDNAFIGMQSTIMDKAIIEEGGFLGAGSLLSPNKIIRKNELWIGRPAKFVRMVTSEDVEIMQSNVQNYLDLAKDYKRSL